MISLISLKTDPWSIQYVPTYMYTYNKDQTNVIHGALLIYFFLGGCRCHLSTLHQPFAIQPSDRSLLGALEESKVIIFHVKKPTTPSRCRFFPSLWSDVFSGVSSREVLLRCLVGKLSTKHAQSKRGEIKSVSSWYVYLVYCIIVLIWLKYAK